MTTKEKFVGNPDALRAWQRRMGFTYDTASAALGISRSSYTAMLAVDVKNPRNKSKIDLRTALACAAIEHGIKPIEH